MARALRPPKALHSAEARSALRTPSLLKRCCLTGQPVFKGCITEACHDQGPSNNAGNGNNAHRPKSAEPSKKRSSKHLSDHL